MLGTGKNSPEKNESNGLIVNLNKREETEDSVRPRKKKSWLNSVKGFFAWLRPSDPAVDFIKNFEETEKKEDLKPQFLKKDFREKSSKEKSRKIKKKSSSTSRSKSFFNFLPLRSYNICQRGAGEIIIFLIQIVWSNLRNFLKFFQNIKRIFKSLKSIISFFFQAFLKLLSSFKKLFKALLAIVVFLVTLPVKIFRIKKSFQALAKLKSIKIKSLKISRPKKTSKTKQEKPLRVKKEKKERKEGADTQAEFVLSRFYHQSGFLVKSLFSFIVLLFLLVLPFKAFSYYQSLDLSQLEGKVLGISEKAISDLKKAAQSFSELNMEGAQVHFSQAGNNFIQAQKELQEINNILLKLSRFAPGEKAKLASISKEVLAAGELASRMGNNLTGALDSLLKIDFEGEEKKIIQRIEGFEKEIAKAEENGEELNRILKNIDSEVLPKEYRSEFLGLREKISNFNRFVAELSNLTEKIKIFLGEEQDRKYLLVFQNSGELRATGGFMGSFALLEFSQGELENIEVPQGGSYDVDGSLNRLIAAPKPLQLVSNRWYFRDSNWWPDWSTSAQKIRWFYENSGGPTVDGVISFTPEVLGSILEITGPLDLREDYGIIITKDNFWDGIRKAIEEEKKEGDHKPKKIISSIFQRLIEKIPENLNRENLVNFLDESRGHLEAKNILFYFDIPELQKEVEKRSWAGRIKETGKDYLAVINTNIAGGKSDRQISQVIDHQAEIQEDGTVIDTLRIEKKHLGATSQYYYGNRNVNWLRVYVPEGSKLLEARGFEKPNEIYFEEPDDSWEKDPLIKKEEEFSRKDPSSNTLIYPEQGKTVFANWTMLDPGESQVIYFKYELPFKVRPEEEQKNLWQEWEEKLTGSDSKKLLPYSLFVQKQPGARDVKLHSRLNLAKDYEILWTFPREVEERNKAWSYSGDLIKDKFLATLLSSR